jgi:hypothetical protein
MAYGGPRLEPSLARLARTLRHCRLSARRRRRKGDRQARKSVSRVRSLTILEDALVSAGPDLGSLDKSRGAAISPRPNARLL